MYQPRRIRQEGAVLPLVLAVGEIPFEFIPGTVFAHVLVLLCLKCIV